jgi:formylmethanofuran dehydrogenase subunit B
VLDHMADDAGRRVTAPHTVSSVVCLGCGCACDDIAVTVEDGKIVEAARACPLGRAWFGDGTVPDAVLRHGVAVSFGEALAEAAELLGGAAGRLLVYVGPELSSEAQRAALALADMLGATVDSATSDTAAAGLLAAQRRGRATATLGEIRNRADLLVFWGVDPDVRYPRYLSRYALDPVGTHVPGGRAERSVVSVTVGADRGLAHADQTLILDPADEIAALSVMRATLLGAVLGPLPPSLQAASELALRLTGAKYVVLVHDAESGDLGDVASTADAAHTVNAENTTARRNPLRVEGLIALTQLLNGPTRAALGSLRAGGNRSGMEAVLTWQTGYPFAVDYSSGVPRYTPRYRGLDRLTAGGFAAALVVGSAAELSREAGAALERLPTVVIGPRASEAPFAPRVAIDTGVAGIHEAGTAYRMDEVPLPLWPSLPSPRAAVETLVALTGAVRARGAVPAREVL